MMQNYKHLKIWDATHLFTPGVYEDGKSFSKEEMDGLTKQLRRCASSDTAEAVKDVARGSEFGII